MMRVFLRDGFIDRYSGEKLLFPPVLRIISLLYPLEFPYHSHWKMDRCHLAYWHLIPTIDHVVPVSRGGLDEEANMVCTSQMKNSVKAGWLLEELGWKLYPAGCADEWDGLLQWAVSYCGTNSRLMQKSNATDWLKAYSDLSSLH
ncbi:MAG: HNH endonuclease [Candidatus Sabulitectum sp.]|nr:HNH endonuclease [Candidatus Sabulitectum sp.]